jgi:gluconokinase
MGVSGSGKSTVGTALAERLHVPFADGDDLHPSANVEKMARGLPLDDSDRWPWLDRVGAWLASHADGGVIACSALRRSYRDRLRQHGAELDLLLLHGDRELLEARQAARVGHFMPPALLASQLATLEPLMPDERGLTVDLARSVDEVVADYLAYASR